ncbi:MAG: (d)CMP kinase [Legionellales bacterium]|nr:(d)CMP kinase [Legionellales bacterium]
MDRNVITIDGPSGSGKSTVAKLLSERLGWSYLDSGAIYRLIAYVSLDNPGYTEDDILVIIENINIKFEFKDNHYRIYLDEKDVTNVIREERIGEEASKLAKNNKIRASLINIQRHYDNNLNLVTDGRDMGTIIFPNASLKLFLTASLEERAARRYLELQNIGNPIDLGQIETTMRARDARDEKRESSPLVAAVDSIHIDTTSFDITEVVEKIYKLWHNKAILAR